MASTRVLGLFFLALLMPSAFSHPFKLLGGTLDGLDKATYFDESQAVHQPYHHGRPYPPISIDSTSFVSSTGIETGISSMTIFPTPSSSPIVTGTETGTGVDFPTGYNDRIEAGTSIDIKRSLFEGPRRHDFVHYYAYVAPYGRSTPTAGSSVGGTYYPTGTVRPYHPTETTPLATMPTTAPTTAASSPMAFTSSSAPYPTKY